VTIETTLAEMLGLPPGEDWLAGALCAQTDPDTFYPDKGGSTRAAKQVCARCPVKADCLEYALAHDERFGIWGGTSEPERRILRRARRQSRRRTEPGLTAPDMKE
jgi:WhiB family redox-sensing transcriptional regulator